MTQLEALEVEPDNPAKVVIDEVAGVIVVGEAVRVSTVAIQQGNLTIAVQETPQVSQPSPFSRGGQTQVTPQSNVNVTEETGRQFVVLPNGASLATLVKGLNALGVTPRDMISILNALKAQGALQAEIQVL
jgi:flagellar P-ring protein precursor FlgI